MRVGDQGCTPQESLHVIYLVLTLFLPGVHLVATWSPDHSRQPDKAFTTAIKTVSPQCSSIGRTTRKLIEALK